MTPNKFNVRNMMRDEVNIAIEWAAKEGWNPGLHDADCFFATDPSEAVTRYPLLRDSVY